VCYIKPVFVSSTGKFVKKVVQIGGSKRAILQASTLKTTGHIFVNNPKIHAKDAQRQVACLDAMYSSGLSKEEFNYCTHVQKDVCDCIESFAKTSLNGIVVALIHTGYYEGVFDAVFDLFKKSTK